jgi:hypothetical protein
VKYTVLLLVLCNGLAMSGQSGVPAREGASMSSAPGVLLEKLTWDEAERVLTPEQVVVIPLGAESKEHGKHLPLNNDWLMAEYLKQRVLAGTSAVVAPTINYSFYPAFLEYPGSTSLTRETARNMVVEIVRSLVHYGPKRFYVLNTGISTLRPLADAAAELEKDGIMLRYTDLSKDNPVEGEAAAVWRDTRRRNRDFDDALYRSRCGPDAQGDAGSESGPARSVNARSEREGNVLSHGSMG